jgi:RNA polymerase sigma factor (sigma-70 family)
MDTATAAEHSSIQTRPSLLSGLKKPDDVDSWNEFYRVYGRVVRDFALKAGLTETEADEVVQETAIGIARHLSEYRSDPKCRFKTWLLNLASWRVKDQFRRRNAQARRTGQEAPFRGDDTARNSLLDGIADHAASLDALFESEWRENLFSLALERIKSKFSLKQIQIFDLVVLKEWPAAEVARSLGVTLGNVYVTRHRISAALRKESACIESEFERAADVKKKERCIEPTIHRAC